MNNKKLLVTSDLTKIRKKFNNENIVLCHGVFDVIHQGHIYHFKSAKNYGSKLVISVTADRFVNKGPNRPFNGEVDRIKFLSELEIVDYVIINQYQNAVPIIKDLKPNFYVKGPDYKIKKNDKTKGIYLEEEAIKLVNGLLKFTKDPVKSSTKIINEIFSNYDESQIENINNIKKSFSLEDIFKVLNSISHQKILLVGEPIIDKYIFTQPLGLGSKSPIVSSKILYENSYTGGVIAIAKNLDALKCNFKTLFPIPKVSKYSKLVTSQLKKKTIKFYLNNWSFPVKTRYVSEFQAQKIFETNSIDDNLWSSKIEYNNFIKKLKSELLKSDILIIADFGHSLFNDDLTNLINKNRKKFKAINVQTNSANQGFNFFSKYNNYDYLSIDERELRLALRDNKLELKKLIFNAIQKKLIRAPFSITLGKKGSLYVGKNNKFNYCPPYFKNVIDTTGAGDAYFVMSSVLTANNCPAILVPFISNLYAGLNTRHLANKDAISIVDLERVLKGLLL